MQMYYEYDIRKEIERLEYIKKKYVPGTDGYNTFQSGIDKLKWVLGE